VIALGDGEALVELDQESRGLFPASSSSPRSSRMGREVELAAVGDSREQTVPPMNCCSRPAASRRRNQANGCFTCAIRRGSHRPPRHRAPAGSTRSASAGAYSLILRISARCAAAASPATVRTPKCLHAASSHTIVRSTAVRCLSTEGTRQACPHSEPSTRTVGQEGPVDRRRMRAGNLAMTVHLATQVGRRRSTQCGPPVALSGAEWLSFNGQDRDDLMGRGRVAGAASRCMHSRGVIARYIVGRRARAS
jgi:hypothetical protein